MLATTVYAISIVIYLQDSFGFFVHTSNLYNTIYISLPELGNEKLEEFEYVHFSLFSSLLAIKSILITSLSVSKLSFCI